MIDFSIHYLVLVLAHVCFDIYSYLISCMFLSQASIDDGKDSWGNRSEICLLKVGFSAFSKLFL